MPRYRRRTREEMQQVAVEHRPGPGPQDPEVLPWFWHPDRDGIRKAPEAFRKRLHEIDKDLDVVFSPVHERWLIWVRNPRVQNWICRGWQMLFLWERADNHEALELSDLVFSNLYYHSSARFPDAKVYFDNCLKSAEKIRAEREKTDTNNRQALQLDFHQSLQISTAGRGNKFALHHDGTLMPSKGEMAWRMENRTTRLPSDAIKQERDDKEREFYGR